MTANAVSRHLVLVMGNPRDITAPLTWTVDSLSGLAFVEQ